MTDKGNATMSMSGAPARVTFLEWYGKGKLNCVVRFEEDCALGKAGAQYIAPTRALKFDGNPPEALTGEGQ